MTFSYNDISSSCIIAAWKMKNNFILYVSFMLVEMKQ